MNASIAIVPWLVLSAAPALAVPDSTSEDGTEQTPHFAYVLGEREIHGCARNGRA